MRYTFARSLIWEGGSNRIDPNGKTVTVKVRKGGEEGERRARSLLPSAGTGREWIRVDSSDK